MLFLRLFNRPQVEIRVVRQTGAGGVDAAMQAEPALRSQVCPMNTPEAMGGHNLV
jgi:hypothetical protein